MTDWPCDNYRAPHTCLTAPSSVAGRCDFCTHQAAALAERIAQAILSRCRASVAPAAIGQVCADCEGNARIARSLGDDQ